MKTKGPWVVAAVGSRELGRRTRSDVEDDDRQGGIGRAIGITPGRLRAEILGAGERLSAQVLRFRAGLPRDPGRPDPMRARVALRAAA